MSLCCDSPIIFKINKKVCSLLCTNIDCLSKTILTFELIGDNIQKIWKMNPLEYSPKKNYSESFLSQDRNSSELHKFKIKKIANILDINLNIKQQNINSQANSFFINKIRSISFPNMRLKCSNRAERNNVFQK